MSTFIHRPERLPDLLAAFEGRSVGIGGGVAIDSARAGRAAGLVLIRGRKNGRADFRLHDGLVLHQGAHHGSDGEDYAPDIQAVLRDGAALPFPV